MDQKTTTGKVSISRKVLNLLELLGEERRNELAKKTALKSLFLKDDKEEKLVTLKEEIKSTIHRLTKGLNRPLLSELLAIFDDDDYGFWTDSYLFKENLIDYGLKVKLNEEMRYVESITKIEALLNSLEKEKELNELNYEELDSIRNEITGLHGIKPLIDVLIYLKHLDLLESNIYEIKNNRPVALNISNDNKKAQFIIKKFDELKSKMRDNQFPFLNEHDYNYYVDLLTLYFDGNEYQLPDHKIETIPRIKGKIISTLGDIYVRYKHTLKPENAFCDIVRVLREFENDSYNMIYKGLRNKS